MGVVGVKVCEYKSVCVCVKPRVLKLIEKFVCWD